MSGKIVGQVWDLELDHAKQLLLLAYADHADHEGGNIYPSIGLIAWKTGYSVRQVQRLTKEVHEDGLLVADETARAKGRKGAMRLDLDGAAQKEPYQNRDAVAGQQKAMRDRLKDRRTPDTVSHPPVTDECHTPPDTQVSHPRDIQVSPEPSVTSSNRPVEANASSGKPQSVETVGLEKYIVDSIYQEMKAAGLRLPNEHFTYHLGRAKDILAKDEPTDSEIEALPDAFVGLWTIKGKADAHSALLELRRQKKRPDLVRVDAGPAPWEPKNPHSPKPPMDPEAYEREKQRRDEVAAMLQSVS